jgi:predicted phosphodiesterase
MKIALITDTHFGARSDSIPFDNFFRKFYDNIFFPTLAQEHITSVIHLGDCFDRRKYINFTIKDILY